MVVIKDEIRHKKETVMFDIDGTLVYFDTIDKLAREALNEYGYNGKEYETGHLIGVRNLLEKSRINSKYFSLENYIIEQQKSMGLSYEDANLVVKKMLELTPKYTKLHTGVSETLRTLDQNLICVSDWFAQIQLNKLMKVGIEHCFRKLYTCEGQYAKPNKKRFSYILNEEGLKAKNCIMVGDSFSDLGALSANIETILIDHNNDKVKLHKSATAVITEFSDLKKILRR